MKIAFMGTPDFAVPSLRALIDSGHDIVGVFTQPDRPKGRGNKVEESPVKKYALTKGLKVFQFEKIRKQEGLDALRSISPELCVTAAFGQILSKKILEVPKFGTINVHASLLPRHRGAAPVNQAIIMGDKVTGVTTMFTDAGLDTGDILLKSETAILPDETAGELTVRLAELGATLLIRTVSELENGTLKRIKQDEALASYEPMMDKAMGLIDWNRSPEEICDLVRGTNPWPGAYTFLKGETLKIWGASVREHGDITASGTVLIASPKAGLVVSCKGGAVEITLLQAPGGKQMTAKAFLSGKKIETGTILGE
ncbi:MAG: methionyl-tRNA formyltransferase [Clostridiales bacterium]|nr:methionyl-tRNA formyltransferase [Clostridiales bacterium]